MPSITNYHNENISQSERDANSASVAATDYVSLAEDYSRRMERSVMQVLHHNDSDYLNPDERLITAVRYHGIIDGKPMFDLYDADNERFTTMSQEDIEDIVDPVGLKTAAVQEKVLHRSSDMFNAISATENVEPFIIEQMEYIGNPVLALNPRVRLSDADGSRNITVGILDFYNVTKTITPAVQEQGEEQALFDVNSVDGVLATSSGYKKINRFLEDHSGDITAFRAIDDRDSSMRGYEFYGRDVKEVTTIFPEFADSVRSGRFPDGKMMDYLFISNDDMRERFVPLVQSLPESIGITITDSPRQMGTALEEVSIPSRDTLGTLLSAGSIAEMIADEYRHWKEAVVYSYDELNAMAQRYTEVFHGKSIPVSLADETFYSYDSHFAGHTVNSVVPQIDRNFWNDSIRGFLDVPTFDFYATNGDLIHTFSKKEIDAIIDPVDLENRRSDIVGSNIMRFFPNHQPFVIDEVDYSIANGLVDTTENNVVFRSNTGPDRGEMWEEVNHFNYLYENVIDRERKDADEALAVEAVARLQGAIMEDEEGPFVVANVEYNADSEYFIISGDNDKGYILADSSYIRELLSPSTHLSYSTESAMNEENIRDEHHEDTHRVVSAEERREAGEDMISRQQIAYPQQIPVEDIKRGDNNSSANVLQSTYVAAGFDLTKVDSNDLRHWNEDNFLGYGTVLPSSFRRAMDKIADDLDRKVNRAIGNNRRDRPSLFDKITPHYSIENGQLAVTFPVKSTLNGGTFEEEEERFGVLRLVYDLTDEGGAKALTLVDATAEANRPTFSYERNSGNSDGVQRVWNHQLLLDPREDYEALLSKVTQSAMLSMVATELRDGLGYDATIDPSTGKVNVSIETIGTVTTKTPVVVDVSYYDDTDVISGIDAKMDLVGDKNNDDVDVSAIVGPSLEAHYRRNGIYDPMKLDVISPIQESYSKAVYGVLRLRNVQSQSDKPFNDLDLYRITRNLTEGQKIGVIDGGDYYEMKVKDVVAAGTDASGRELFDIIGKRHLVYNERIKSNEYVEDHSIRVSADVLRQLLDNRYNANVQELRGGEAGQPPLTIVVDPQEQDRLFIATKMKESLLWQMGENIYDLSQYTAEFPVMHESSVDNKNRRTAIGNLNRIASYLRSNANRIRPYEEITPIERVASLLRKNLDVVGKDYNYTVLPRRASDGNASLRLLAPHIDTPIQLRYEGDEVRGTGRLIASVDLYDTGRRFVQTAYDIANDKDIDEESLIAFVRETINAYHREKMAISLQETYRNNLVEIDNGTLYVPRNSMPGSRNQPPFVLDVDYGIDNHIEKVTITLPAYDQQEVDRDADAVEQNITYVQEYDGDDRERIGYEQIKKYIEQILSDYAAKRQVEKFTSIPLGRPVEDYLNAAKANGDAITIFHRAVDNADFIIGEHAGNDLSLGTKHGVVGTITTTDGSVPVAIEFFDSSSRGLSAYELNSRGYDVVVHEWPPTDSAQTSIRFLATPQTMHDFAVGAYGRNLASDTVIVMQGERGTNVGIGNGNVSVLFKDPAMEKEFRGNLWELGNGLYSKSYDATPQEVEQTVRSLQAKGYNVIELYGGRRTMATANDERIERVSVTQHKKVDRSMLESLPQTEEEMINRFISDKALSFQQAAYDNTTDRWISAFRDNSTTAVVASVALRDDNDNALVTFNDGTTRSVDKYNLINAILEGMSTIPVKGASADSNISHYEHIISENIDIIVYERDLSILIASSDMSMVFPGDEQATKIEKVSFSADDKTKGLNVTLNDRLSVPYGEFVKFANDIVAKDRQMLAEMKENNTLRDLSNNIFYDLERAGKLLDMKSTIEDGKGKIRALLSDGYDIELTVHFADKQSDHPSRMDVTRVEERVTRVGGAERRTGDNITPEENAHPSMRDERVLDTITQLMSDLRQEASEREAFLSSAAARIAVATGNAQGVEIHCDNSRNEARLPYDDTLEFYVTFDFREDNSVWRVSVETEAKDKDISTFLRRNATNRYSYDDGTLFDATEISRYIAIMLSEYRRAVDFKKEYTDDIRQQQEGEIESIKTSLLNHPFIRGRVSDNNILVVNELPHGGDAQKVVMMLDNGLTVNVNVVRDDDFQSLTDVIVSGKYTAKEKSPIVGGEIEKSMDKEALSQYPTMPSAHEVVMRLSDELLKELSVAEARDAEATKARMLAMGVPDGDRAFVERFLRGEDITVYDSLSRSSIEIKNVLSVADDKDERFGYVITGINGETAHIDKGRMLSAMFDRTTASSPLVLGDIPAKIKNVSDVWKEQLKGMTIPSHHTRFIISSVDIVPTFPAHVSYNVYDKDGNTLPLTPRMLSDLLTYARDRDKEIVTSNAVEDNKSEGVADKAFVEVSANKKESLSDGQDRGQAAQEIKGREVTATTAAEEPHPAAEQTTEDSILAAKQQWASSLATVLSQAAEAGDGVWLNGGYKQQPAIYPKMTKVGPFNSMLLALHSDKENTPTNVYMFYTGAHYSATPIREGEKGVTLAISKGDHRELRGLFNITQTLMSERAKSMKDYDRVIARYSGGDKALAAREAARQTTADSYIAMLRGGLVNVEYNGSSIPHYDTDKDTLYLPPVGNRDERVYLEEVVRCAIAATGAPHRLNRSGWDATLAADGESYEMLVREVATGVKLMELGYPGVLSSRAQVLVPEWCRELRENPALIDKLFRDVNRAVNMLHDVERGKIVNMQHMSVPMPDSQRDDKQEKTAGEAVDAAAQRKYIVQDLRKRVNTDQCFMVIVADKAAGHADVLLPQGASPTMLFNDGEMGEKDFIRQQLANEGITDVSFFNPTGAYGYDKNDIYFQGKEVYTAMLTRSAMERIADLDVSANVALAEMPIFEKIQMVRDDDNKWAMALKAKGQEAFLVYPAKEDIGRFFTTVKENPSMTDAVRMQLGRKYYGLTAPNAATDRHPLIAADTSGIDMSLIKKVQLFKTQKGEFLCRLTGADGMPPLQAQYVSAGQWQRMWLAADKDEYKSLLAAKLFGDVLREQTAQRAEQVQRTLAELQSKQSKTVSSAISSTTQQEKGVDAPAVQSVIQQYHSLKEKHPEAVLLFRCGSTVDGAAQYYEMFLDDAKKGAEVLGLPITTMTDKRYGEVSVVRFPHDDLDVNLLQLIRHGNRVAVVEALDKQPMRGLGDNKAIAPISRAGYEEVSVVLNGQTFAWRDLNGDGDIDGNEIRVERVALSADQRFIAIAGTDPASGEELSATVTAKELYDKLHALHPSRSLCAADLAGEKMTPVTGNGVWYNNIGEYTFNEPAMKGWAECAKEDSPLRVNTPKGGVVEIFSEYDSFDDAYTYRIADGGSVTTYDNFSAFRDGLSQRGIEFIGMRVYDTKDVATEEAATQGEAQQGSRSEGALRPNANDVLLVEKFVGRTVEYDAGDKMLRFAIEDVDGVNDEVLLAVDDDKKTMDMVSVATAAAMIADGRWRIVEQAQATVDVASLHDDENTTAVAVAQALSSQVHSTDVKFIEATLRGETLTLRHPLDAEEADFSHILYADPDRKDPDVVTLIAKNGDKLILDKESVLESMFSNGKPSTLDFAFTGDVPEKIATYNELLNDALAGERVTFSDGEKGQVEEVELFLEDGELLVDVETKEQGEHVMPYNDFTSSVYVIVARTAEEEVNIGNDKAKEVVANNDVANNDISSPYILDDKTYVTVTYNGEQWQCRQINDIDDEPLIIASSDLLDTLAPREMQGEDLSFADTAAEELYDKIFYFTSDKDALSLSDDALTAVMAKEHPGYFATTQRPAILTPYAAELKVLDKSGHRNAIVFIEHDTSYRAYGDDAARVQAIKPEVKVSSVMQADGSRISMAEIPVFCMDRFQKEAALKGVDVATLNIKADDSIVDGKLVAKRNATVEVMPKVDSDIAAVIRDRQESQRMLTAQLGLADRNSKQRYSYETGKSNFNYSYKIDLGNGYTLQGKEEFSRKNSREAFVSDGLRLTLCSDRGYEPLTAAAALKADDPQLAVKVRWLIEGYAEGLKLPQEESPEQVGESAKQQYSTAIYDEMQAIKNENGQDIVVMFRGEELVEMYGRDAEVANNVLHVPVEFSKEQGTPNGRPMLVAIFPMDRVKGYVERLQQQSHGVAVWNLPREVIKERNEKQDANNNEELDMQQHRSRRR